MFRVWRNDSVVERGNRAYFNALILDETEWVRTLTVRQLPCFVQPGWLRPLMLLDEPLDRCLAPFGRAAQQTAHHRLL